MQENIKWKKTGFKVAMIVILPVFSLVGIVEHSFVDIHVGFSDTPMMSSVVVIMSTL